MATAITGVKENSGVIGVLFVEFGLGETLIVEVDEAAVVVDGELVGDWVKVTEGNGDEEIMGAWLVVGGFVGDKLGEDVGEAKAAA